MLFIEIYFKYMIFGIVVLFVVVYLIIYLPVELDKECWDYEVCYSHLQGKCDDEDVAALCPKTCGQCEAPAFGKERDFNVYFPKKKWRVKIYFYKLKK